MKPGIWFAAGAVCALILGKSVPVAFGGGTVGNAAAVSWNRWVAATANGDVYLDRNDGTGYHFRANAFALRPTVGRVVSIEGSDAGAIVVVSNGDVYQSRTTASGDWEFGFVSNWFDVIPRPAGPSPIAQLNFNQPAGGYMVLESGDLYNGPGGTSYPLNYVGNIFANVPVSVEHPTWSKVKGAYR